MNPLLQLLLPVGLIVSLLMPVATHQPTPPATNKSKTEMILGADISFLPELEAKGIKFTVDGKQDDAIMILKKYGFNYIRLRLFADPQADSGYSKEGYCGLPQTIVMAKRIKQAGMKWLLDFHYSDNWADPQKQFKPDAWKHLPFPQLTQTVHDYTFNVMTVLSEEGVLPDMVQIGNEINHGMLWPEGSFEHPDSLALLIKAGIAGVKEVAPSVKIMLHIALGGQNKESIQWLDAMTERGIQFDIIGESYYPQWHGTIAELQQNLNDLSSRYKQDVLVAEYTQHKTEVNDIAFNLPDGERKGTFIWEPLNTWEFIFDKQGNAIDSLLNLYPVIAKKYKVR